MIRFPCLSVQFVLLIISKIHDMEFFGINRRFVILWPDMGKKKQVTSGLLKGLGNYLLLES